MIVKNCATCGGAFNVQPCVKNRARFCSRACLGRARAEKMRGNTFRAGHRPANAFERGHEPWNRDMKGIHLSPATEFTKGIAPANKAAVGTERVREDRDGDRRAWVKVAEPNVWRPRAVVAWEAAHGPVPRGMIVHHENRDTLDDRVENLRLVSRAEHLVEHRPEFEPRRRASVSAATKRRFAAPVD